MSSILTRKLAFVVAGVIAIIIIIIATAEYSNREPHKMISSRDPVGHNYNGMIRKEEK